MEDQWWGDEQQYANTYSVEGNEKRGKKERNELGKSGM